MPQGPESLKNGRTAYGPRKPQKLLAKWCGYEHMISFFFWRERERIQNFHQLFKRDLRF